MTEFENKHARVERVRPTIRAAAALRRALNHVVSPRRELCREQVSLTEGCALQLVSVGASVADTGCATASTTATANALVSQRNQLLKICVQSRRILKALKNLADAVCSEHGKNSCLERLFGTL